MLAVLFDLEVVTSYNMSSGDMFSYFLCFPLAEMLPGLQEGQEKMSKSDPSSSIYMEDEEVPSGSNKGNDPQLLIMDD